MDSNNQMTAVFIMRRYRSNFAKLEKASSLVFYKIVHPVHKECYICIVMVKAMLVICIFLVLYILCFYLQKCWK